ncbi:2-oxoacid:acceptor oxidoreductase subunit alpha [Sedimenticola thiotaurini]|uniref:2-oxoglutarate synthase n=1 Tax=Sedimenticola thiotaurini TaxID=1543721 RepID=A0A0F7K0G3_9GAMM|nr:2-oxoacid:acceptor oxidoreductase subunit alpha [Sedimenticola thiotaurini]AKH20650.1 2-oxoglutarate synthase [Sedimenticola thiotaurini]
MDRKSGVTDTESLSLAIVGSGGSGVVTTGTILLESIARFGLYALMTRSSGPQIRGGESAIMLRVADHPVDNLDDRFDLLLALDWQHVDRFTDELPIDPTSLILHDNSKNEEVPAAFNLAAERQLAFPFAKLAADIEHGRANMVALGLLAQLMGLPQETVKRATRDMLKTKGEAVVMASLGCIELGFAQVPTEKPIAPLTPPAAVSRRWNISGNEASGLGAVQGGVRFVAAYPITPASGLLEWLAPNLEQLGGALVQAEDELASINMAIGASFGGVPSLTATSGPGLSLMMEGLGLAVASETPVVVNNVMRGGPSTGIPTKSEQSDLNIALYGLHGDAPHLVLSALSIRDCTFTTEWAVKLAETLQSVAIVLTDQSQGQARAVIDPPSSPALEGRRKQPTCDAPYQRYAVTDDGISPMAIPGEAECMYTADGLEHNQRGTPSAAASDHQRQLDKRLRKLTDFDYGDDWAELSGAGEICLISWGSASGATREAAERLSRAGHPARCIAVRLLAPLPTERFSAAIAGATRLLVVEQNHGGQFYRYLNSCKVLPSDTDSLARPGPLPLRPQEIVNRIMQGL